MAELENGAAGVADAILHWDFVAAPHVLAQARIRTRRVGDVRITDLHGGACQGRRTSCHDALDRGDFVGIVCKLEGEETCTSESGEALLRPGDILVWRNRGELSFHAADPTRKLILLMPAARVDAVLRKPFDCNSLVLPGSSALGALTPKFLTALCANLELLADREAQIAVDMALDLVGLALDNAVEEESSLRTTLYERAVRYIGQRLDDAALSPGEIAKALGISRRYLHLVFAQRGETVSGWIREHRLLHCRDELQRGGERVSLTEIAHRWGYCDSAHFSRSFKRRFGMAPRSWRDQMAQA